MRFIIVVGSLLLFWQVAHAEPLPSSVAAMITEAAKSPDTLKTVVKVAKAINPGSTAEIDALVGQLNAEAAAIKEQKLAQAGIFDAWTGGGQVGFSKTTGNTSDTTIALGLNLAKDGLKFRHKLNGAIDRQVSSGKTTVGRYLANYELDYKLSSRLYTYGLFGWDRDVFAGYTRRFSESAGLGYSFLKTPRMKLDLTAGPGLRQTRYITGLSQHTTTARAGADFSWEMFDRITLTEVAGVYFDGAFTSTTALTGKVTDKVSGRVSFDVNHEVNVAAGRKSTDTSTKASLVYGF